MFSPENLTKYRLGGKESKDFETTTYINFEDKIARIIDLMESKYTVELTDRQLEATQKLVDEMNNNKSSFFYKDLQTLAKFITIIFYRIQDGNNIFIEELISIVKLCNKPFLKEKTSDELNHVPKTTYLLNSLSLILQNNNSGNDDMYLLFVESLNFLNEFSGFGIDEYKNQDADYQMKKLYGNNFSLINTLHHEGTRNLRLMSTSDILESLVYLLTTNIHDEACTIIVINIMINCSLYKSNAEKLANLGVLKDLVSIISNAKDFRTLLVRVCIEAIWNILENGGKSACRMMAYEEIVNSLFSTFHTVIRNCFRLDDRNIRNDICILINYVVSSPESHLYFIYKDQNPGNINNKTSFLDNLLYFATYDEIISIQKEMEFGLEKSGISGNKSRGFLNPAEFKFTTSPEDVEFKKIIWTCILYIIKDNYMKKEVFELLHKYRFILCLLLYLDPEAMKFSCISRWQQPQLKDIQMLSMSILLNVIPLYQIYFEEIKGYSTLIKFLQIYSDKERRQLCLKTINNIINSEMIKKELTEEKLIDFLLEIINNPVENSLESREYAFNIISQMCVENKLAQKEFRRKGGIDTLKRNLNYLHILDQIGNQRIFILVVLDCLWNSVMGNKRNEELFIEIEGLFTIFQLLEQSDDIHIKIILSCLASLVDNKRSFSYFIQWKSNSNLNIDATKLLINVYREEDKKYGVKYNNGILVNRERPINPATSYKKRKEDRYEEVIGKKSRKSLIETYNTNLSKEGSKNSTNYGDENVYRNEDFIENYLNVKISQITKSFDLRETIFSIFYRIGFNNITISSSEDKQTFVIIRNYPVFKNLEKWKDILEELEDNNIYPISDDINMVKSQIEDSEEKCVKAIRQQEIIYENINKAQQDELKAYFNKIQEYADLRNKNVLLKMNEKANV